MSPETVHSYGVIVGIAARNIVPLLRTPPSNVTINIWTLATTLDQPVSGIEGILIDGGAPYDPSSSFYQGLNRLQWSIRRAFSGGGVE